MDVVLSGNSLVQEQQQIITPKETGTTIENIASGVADVVSGIGGLFDMQPSGQDETEAEYLRQQVLSRKKPKKRRGFGL